MKATKNLHIQLDAWRLEAQSFTSNRTLRRAAHWSVYAAAAGSALSMSTNAAAGVITYSGVRNLTASISSVGRLGDPGPGIIAHQASQSAFIGGTLPLFSFDVRQRRVNTASPFVQGFASVDPGPGVEFLGVGSHGLRKLSSGNVVSSAGAFGNNRNLFRGINGRNNSRHSYWAPSQIGFVGFEALTRRRTATAFGSVSTVGPGLLGYGWIRLKYTESSGNTYPNSITVVDWAYTIDGSPIDAGDIGVPEPGTGALALLAAGAAGIAAWRKRRAGNPTA